MLKSFKTFLLAASIASSCLAADTPDPVVATFNQGDVKVSDIMGRYVGLFEGNPNFQGKTLTDLPYEMQKQLVTNYVNSKLIEVEVQNSKVQDTPEFATQLDNAKKQIAQGIFLDNIVKSRVLDKDIKAEVTKLKNQLKDKEEAKIKHILVGSKKEAEDAKKKILKGEKFDALAKKLSTDEGSKGSGGELDYMSQEGFEPEFGNKVFGMKKGEVSGPIQSSFGWHIVQMVDKRKIQMPSDDQLESAAKNNLSRVAFDKYMEEISTKAGFKLLIEEKKEEAPKKEEPKDKSSK